MNELAHLPTLLSTDRLCNLIKYSQLCAPLGGYIAEFGVYTGGSLEVLAKHNRTTEIIGIDSFQGLPKPSEHDYHQEGDFSEGVNFQKIYGYFGMMYNNVRLVKGFAPKVWEYFDEHTRFSFVHTDVDLFESVMSALDFFLPRLLTGGIMIVDDYKVRSTPGCEKAITEFFTNHDVSTQFRQEELFYYAGKSHHQYLIRRIA